MIDKSVRVLGVPVSILDSYDHACDFVVSRIKERKKMFCVAINPEKILRAKTDPHLRELIEAANMHICDGIGAAVGARILAKSPVTRITGVQLFYDLMVRAEMEGFNVFLLGAKPEVVETARERLMEKHPNLRIVGHCDGYFGEHNETVDRINQLKTDMLFVAMGSPTQEEWIARYRDELNVPYCMGVGGTFDVASGYVKWAPKFFRRTGTEWLYRLVANPTRIRRQIKLFKFVWLVGKQAVRRRASRS